MGEVDSTLKCDAWKGRAVRSWRVFMEDPAPGADLEACGHGAVHYNTKSGVHPCDARPGIEAAI
jgi:hypothetical protein